MKHSEHYPSYISYENRKKRPSVLAQEYPLPVLAVGEVYYPADKLLDDTFSSPVEQQLYGAARFNWFLNDTINVEYRIVIPAVMVLRELPMRLPKKTIEDLFKTATDEMFHGEQSLTFLDMLEEHFGLPSFEGKPLPLFIRRLQQQIKDEEDLLYQQLLPVVNGIVTETRISHELGEFAANHSLSSTVRDICRSHAIDEVVHADQFRALATWLWNEADETMKSKLSHLFVKSAIARSMPDIDAIIISYARATNRSLEDAGRVVLARYTEEELVDQMLFAVKPSFHFLKVLGINEYIAPIDLVSKEKEALRRELVKRKSFLNIKACA